MRGIISKSTIQIRNPDSIRPWQHVLDPLNGYLELSEKLYTDGSKYSEGWNFGPYTDNDKPVSWILEKIKENWREQISWNPLSSDDLHEENYLGLDCSKAQSRLNYKPRLSLEQAIKLTTDWYKAYEQNKDVRVVTETQIEEFLTFGN